VSSEGRKGGLTTPGVGVTPSWAQRLLLLLLLLLVVLPFFLRLS
jgi:hypothetical protein